MPMDVLPRIHATTNFMMPALARPVYLAQNAGALTMRLDVLMHYIVNQIALQLVAFTARQMDCLAQQTVVAVRIIAIMDFAALLEYAVQQMPIVH